MVRLFTPSRVVFALAVVVVTHYVIIARQSSQDTLRDKFVGQWSPRESSKAVAIGRKSFVVPDRSDNRNGDDAIETPSGECMEDEENWDHFVKPKYPMDPNKFLIPTLLNGPNNQMIGFRQSIMVALLLNRTLVLPAFYDHEVQGGMFRKPLSAEHRIDVRKLRSFVSVVSNQKAVKLCNSRIDVIFAAKGKSHVVGQSAWRKIVRIYMDTGLSGTEFVDGVGEEEFDSIKKYIYDNQRITKGRLTSKPWWPRNRTDTTWMLKIAKGGKLVTVLPEKGIPTKLEDVQIYYKTPAKCALYWFPFNQFTYEKTSHATIKETEKVSLRDLDTRNSWKLYSDVVKSTQPPRVIRAWADEFRQRVFGSEAGDYLAVHWRFDDKDFFGYICKESAGRKEFCDEVRRASNATAIAAAIRRRIDEVQSLHRKTIKAVYFAAPPTLEHLVESVERRLKNSGFPKNREIADSSSEHEFPSFFSGKHVKKFILQRYRGCNMASSRRLSDTISQIEMRLCQSSFSFMWSRQSTWSRNVKLQRFIQMGAFERKVDVSINNYALEAIDGKKQKI